MAVRIVILGGSFGGLTAAFDLKRHLGKKADVTVVSDLDNFLFVPSLPWVSMGWRRPEDITLQLEKILKPKGINFIHAEATGIDAVASKVITKTKEIEYDYLVIATGPALVFSAVPGLGPEGGYTECIFTLEQALRCNGAWRRFLKDPGPVVTGSVQGVSCFGPTYEFAFEVDAELRKRKIRHKVPITFVTSEPYIGHLGVGGLGKSKRIMEDAFAEREIKVITNMAVEEFTPGEARLKDGTKLPFKLSMFAPPMAGVKAVFHLGNPKGFIPVDENYRHKEHKNIFSVGVAVAMAPPEQTPVPTGLPKTGFMSVKMAKEAAKSIASEILGRELPQAEPLDVICLMDMGDTAAFMKAKPLLPPRQESELKSGIKYKWMKSAFEKYYLWKIKHGLTQLP
ncbi:NADH dehydrogenase-like protein [bacterium BMS3Abin07]|nr:NADH dehydrogenase-like protein [bacterium BMS3Abin07]GBE31706.1 NADH dehydrogenase-like protein [bacterium BMS3Bbin05]HDO21862.1 sulfide:quinone reductase [Nitrospirota bacterium]HDZ88252.1 sulfide:quinone reductase [Nitrospirota bacterium]